MFQKLGIQLRTISSSILYMILIFVLIKSWMALMDEESAFEEKIVENERKIPSFTLCPYGANESMETFEDVATAITNIESKFTIEYSDYDSNFEEARPLVENYNNTLDSIWKFVPMISTRSPSEDTICLIWTPPTDRRPKWKTLVSTQGRYDR